MKNLDLNAYGVQEMNTAEMQEENGGSVIVDWLVGGFLFSLAGELILEGADKCLEDFKKGYNEVRNEN